MRHILFLIIAAMFVGSSVTAQEREFEPGDVWGFKSLAYENAVLFIEAIEERRETSIVHMSVFGLPGPHSSAPLFESLREIVEPYGQENEPLSYLAGGHSDENGRYTSMTAELTLIPGDTDGQIAIPHIVAYESELREAVSNIRPEDWSQHSMYNKLKSHWNQGERDWPELLDAELEWPFISRIDTVVRSVTVSAFDETLTSHM